MEMFIVYPTDSAVGADQEVVVYVSFIKSNIYLYGYHLFKAWKLHIMWE